MKRTKVRRKKTLSQWLRENRWSIAVLAVAAVLFIVVGYAARPEPEEETDAVHTVYENGRIVQILSDSTELDERSDNAYRGEQLMLVDVTTGEYAGKQLQVYNYVAPIYGVPLKVGSGVTLQISVYDNGDLRATVFEYNREPIMILVVVLFLVVTVLVGGKTGAKSLIGLIVTLACLLWILLPLLMKGAPTLLTVFLVCAYAAAVCFVLLGGVSRKTACALLGTILGMGIALLFGLLAQTLAKIDGLRNSEVEPLLQLRQDGVPLGLKGLLVGGIVISTLGAVMDVAMSISSALSEVHAVNPTLNRRQLFRSGMNIGRDMVGTMTNTLILAFFGSSFTLILYLYSLGLQPHQLFSSAYLAREVISGISSSIGVILSVPITAFISSILMENAKVEPREGVQLPQKKE